MDLLASSIQNYRWGDPSFIPELQRRAPSGTPEAELWIGAHPKAPSQLSSSGIYLDDHIASDPAATLGHAERFGSLPFLKKVLAAAQPLSIQTHPNASQARAGFDRENQAGIAVDDPTRTYRDPNHKPELICALTPFDAKCGFRPLDQTRDLLSGLRSAGTQPLIDRIMQPGNDTDVIADVLQWLLTNTRANSTKLTAAIMDACTTAGDSRWIREISWTHRIHALYPGDPGVIVALLLNHFTLEPGEALFLDAGVLHAYVQGAGIEIMANSDNVIRGGLTPKHVDTVELAAVASTMPIDPPVQRPTGPHHTFDSPVEEFSLSRLVIDGGFDAVVSGPEVLIVTDGAFRLSSADRNVTVRPGSPVWVEAADQAWSVEGAGTLFRTTVPA